MPIDRNVLKCDCKDGSNLNGAGEPIVFSFLNVDLLASNILLGWKQFVLEKKRICDKLCYTLFSRR